MNIVSYNLHFGGKTVTGNPWQQLLTDFQPDFVFAQESFDPRSYAGFDGIDWNKERCVWAPVKDRNWGSAILSRHYNLEPVVLPAHEGWVVGARVPELVVGGVSQSVLLFSIHAPSPGPYEPSVNRILDDIAKVRDGQALIVAGDFNVTTAQRNSAEPLSNTSGERRILQRLRTEFGLRNAWQFLHPTDDLPQTLRWSGARDKPYHCDAVFMSDIYLPSLAEARIVSSGVWGQMSDHNPVVVTIE